jgi:putative membrane protein
VPDRRALAILIALFFAGYAWSAIRPHDYFTWFLETFPAGVAFIVLAFTYKRFQFTTLAYTLIVIHCWVLFIGGHYTYAEVPLFNWIREAFHQNRNNYDKVGHFMQGFVPALIAREFLVRRGIVTRKGWAAVLCVCVAGAFSASYELFEWAMSEATGSAADAFLGGQGDPWDTQKDMMWAFIGALTAMLVFVRVQDGAIAKLEQRSHAAGA